jgi:3-oxoadipate enol-lactonase
MGITTSYATCVRLSYHCDRPGHGASGMPSAHFTTRQCAEAALQVLDKEGVQSATFLGVSWGGFVCMQTAVMAPERVTSLVLSNTSAYRMSALIRFRDQLISTIIRIGFPGNLGKAFASGLFGASLRKNDLEFIKGFVSQANALNKVALSRAVSSVLVEREDQGKDLHLIKVPTLVIAGAADMAFPPHEHSERIARGIVGSQYKVIADVGHVAPREAPSEFNALLQTFF